MMQVTVVYALMEAKVRTTVRSYNDMKATKAAVSNLFPGFSEACVERPVEDGVFLLEAMRPLDRFFELLREQRILDTAMDVMAQGIVGDRTTFRLNRLAASRSRVGFVLQGETPLGGHIEVTWYDDHIRDEVEAATWHHGRDMIPRQIGDDASMTRSGSSRMWHG